MKEYEEAIMLSKIQQKQNRQLIVLTVVLMVLGSIFILLDVVRVNPMVIFLLLMLVPIGFAIKTRVTSSQYDNLLKYLKRHEPKSLKQKELVLFMDQQLSKKYEVNELRQLLKSKEPDNELLSEIQDMIAIFNYLEVGEPERRSPNKKVRKKKEKIKKTSKEVGK